MIEAQRTYTEIETNIAAARRFYNASVASTHECRADVSRSALERRGRRPRRAADVPDHRSGANGS